MNAGAPPRLALLSAGAARGLVATMAPAFTAETGVELDATFGAVGALVEKLERGEPCDAIVLTAALIARLEGEGRVRRGTARPLGHVVTSIAVPSGTPRPAIGDATALRATLASAVQLYFPDHERATAGIHFAGVLQRLGLGDRLDAPGERFANGAAAMAALARAAGQGHVGCTQASEILDTPGVVLVGPLPPGFELATVYAVAVASGARAPEAAHRLAALLAGPAARAMRERCGFEEAGPA